MAETLGSTPISTRLHQVAALAKARPQTALTTLAHHIDLDLLLDAYRRTRKDGAVGVDGQRADQYAEHLDANLRKLLERAKSGTYRAPAVRRVRIPKGDGTRTRPIGIPTFEDKVLQRAVLLIVEAISEQDFADCSYGFRPRRSAHHALQALWEGVMHGSGGWVLELDIEDFFGSLDHQRLRQIVRRRVRDGVLLRLIGKWLRAGVMEDGRRTYPDAGTPQGGVISPWLANVYLHEVLDAWFTDVVHPRLRGHARLVRFADDAVLVFTLEDDARRVAEVLPKRFAKYGLTLHPEKTRLLPFAAPTTISGPGARCRATFDFLGFTHYWGYSRRGAPIVKRKTATARLSRALRAVRVWCRTHRHLSIPEQHHALRRKLLGHDAYYGITGNGAALERYRFEVRRIWRKWLSRRSDRASMPWTRFRGVLARYPLPPARVVHSVYRVAASP